MSNHQNNLTDQHDPCNSNSLDNHTGLCRTGFALEASAQKQQSDYISSANNAAPYNSDAYTSTKFASANYDQPGVTSHELASPVSTNTEPYAGQAIKRKESSGAKITALYERLSHDDEQQGPSNSIINQRQMLEDFALRAGMRNIRHFSDDGWSGTRWDRPGFLGLMDEVEAGNVSALLVKDMSRLGRDHLRVGLCLETLMEKGVRLVAVSDGIDTDKGDDDFMPFRNIMAEWYARDISRKIKAVKRMKGNSGKPLSATPPYGYIKDPADKEHWLVDAEAAAVVRRIFRMTIEGFGPFRIARLLGEEKIEKPSHYFVRNGLSGAQPTRCNMAEPYNWNIGTVIKMLSNPQYAGHTVNFRITKESFRKNKRTLNPKEEWKVFPDTHEAIVDQETFDTVQRLRKTPRRADAGKENRTQAAPNPLSGLTFCADCGAKMYNSRKTKKTPDFYTCSSHTLAYFKSKKACSAHYIRTDVIRDVVLRAIREVSVYALSDEAAFAERLRSASAVRREEAAKVHRSQLSKNARRIAEIDLLYQRTYEDNVSGKLNDERFFQISGAYEREQAKLKAQSAALKTELDAYAADGANAESFLALARRQRSFDELTTPMLNEFISRIVIHAPDRSSGERRQRVDVHFNFIGNFEVPKPKLTPAEEAVAAAARAERIAVLEKRREANRRQYAKKKARKATKEGSEVG